MKIVCECGNESYLLKDIEHGFVTIANDEKFDLDVGDYVINSIECKKCGKK